MPFPEPHTPRLPGRRRFLRFFHFDLGPDRVRVALPEKESDLLGHADWIKNEVLAVSVATDPSLTEPRIERA